MELNLYQRQILKNAIEDRIKNLKKESLFDKSNIDIKDEIQELNNLLKMFNGQ